MKKKIIAIICMLIMILSLVACKGTPAVKDPEKQDNNIAAEIHKRKDESAIEEIRSQMQNLLADSSYCWIEAVITYDNSTGIALLDPDSITVGSGTRELEVKEFLAELGMNVGDYSFSSNAYKEKSKITFVLKDERVKVYREAIGEKYP